MKLISYFILITIYYGTFLSPVSEAYKILVFSPRLGHSHLTFLGHIADVLVEAGHDVVVYTFNFSSGTTGNGTKLANVIEDKSAPNLLFSDTVSKDMWQNNGDNIIEVYQFLKNFNKAQFEQCRWQVENAEMIERLKMEHFDLGITEVYSTCGYVIFHKIGLKKYVSAFATNLVEILSDPLGASSNPSYIPAAFSENTDMMSFRDRFSNFVIYMTTLLMSTRYLNPNHVMIEDKVHGFRFWESLKKSSLAIVNADELLDFPRLISQKIIYIGGIAVKKPMPLNQDFGTLMNKSESGVVLVSFGSVAKSSSMPNSTKRAFYDAFKAFPQITFIWKYELDDGVAEENLPNVHKRKWVPQNDLLGHPNLRAFVSHCGQNSLTESVHAGVPLICIPLFGDQMRNAKVAERKNVGIIVHKNDLTKGNLIISLETILFQNKHQESSKRLAKMISRKPFKPRESLIKNINFLLQFGPFTHLNIAGADLHFLQYYLIDIIVPIMITLLIITLLIAKFIINVIRNMYHFKIKVD